MLEASSLPLSLNHIEETGATRFGRAITHITITTEDGRKIDFDVPIRTEPIFGEELRFTSDEALIVDLFRRLDADERKRGVQIASLMREDPEKLKRHLASLVRMGVLDNDREGRTGYFRGKNFPQTVTA